MNKSDILNYIKSSPAPVNKRDVANAFHVKGGEPRIELKRILKELEDDGEIQKYPGGNWGIPEGLPEVAVLEVTDITIDGDVFAKPGAWDKPKPPPRIEIIPDKKIHAPAPGTRVLARLKRLNPDEYEATIIRLLDTAKGRIMGVVRIQKGGPVLQPADRKAKYDYEIIDLKNAKNGDLVVTEIQPSKGMRKRVRVMDVIGHRSDPKAISLISLHEAGLNEKFPQRVIDETKGMSVPSPQGREDLRNIPLVTIDGIDAKDFDDAVFAEKTDEGFHLIVAIADVAYYVRNGTALDDEAKLRGNSTYFPDRVVPMLPEALSNDLCSLRPNEPRACLAMHMWIDRAGKLIRHKIVRGLMQSKARLTYEQVQHMQDTASGDLLPIIKPLYEAFKILDDARRKRGALELDLPERKVVLDDEGRMIGVKQRERLESHKLIEEFMVLANVAAAQALEARKAPCVYRVHDRPSSDKLESAREFIESFGLSLPKGQVTQPAQLNTILIQANKLPYSHLISDVVLRTQSQAQYSPENIGHFGLALAKYAHFTSPIRRYADLIVHRSLISAYNLGPGGIDEGEIAQLEETCIHISATERTSMEAERSAVTRFTASFLSSKIGAEFAGRITGVTRFGLFVMLSESGADGLVPIRTLPHDFYIHDEDAHALIGRRSGRVFRLGAPVTVRLREADGVTGSTLLGLVGHDLGADIPGMELPGRRFKPGKERRDNRRNHKKNKKNFRGKRR